MADHTLEDILAQIAGLGERGSEVPRVALRTGLVEAVDPDDGSITIRIGDYGPAVAYYPGLTAVGAVAEGDAVAWLQDFSGTGVVLGVSTPGVVSNSSGIYSGPYPPDNPPDNKLWFNTNNGKLYIWFDDGNSEQWVDLSGGGAGGASVISSDTPPTSPTVNSLWFNTSTGQLFLYYGDIDSAQWVEVGGNSPVTSGSEPPPDPTLNTLWFSSITGQLFIWYSDGDTEQWVEVSGGAGSGGGTTWLTLTTAEEWFAATTAAMERPDHTLYLAEGEHVMPVPSGYCRATSDLIVQGAGRDQTHITIEQDYDTQTDIHYCFQSDPNINFEMRDLSVTGPTLTDPRDASKQVMLFSIRPIGLVVDDDADVVLRFDRILITDTDDTNMVGIFQVPGGEGLGRLRMYVEDCELGRTNGPISLFGPDGGDRIAYLNRVKVRDSGGSWDETAPETPWPAYGHTIYYHPSNSIVATDCEFGPAKKYHLHHYSGGGRTVPNKIPSSFTNCYFDVCETSPAGSGGLYNQDAIVTAEFTGCTFTKGIMYLYGRSSFTGCHFKGGLIVADANPVVLTGCEFETTTYQPGIARGQDVTFTGCRFSASVGLHAQNATDHYTFHSCTVRHTGLLMEGDGLMEFFDTTFTDWSSTSNHVFTNAGGTLRYHGCRFDFSGYTPAGWLVSIANAPGTVEGFGNMVLAGRKPLTPATVDDDDMGWIQRTLTPVGPNDLVPKSYADSLLGRVSVVMDRDPSVADVGVDGTIWLTTHGDIYGRSEGVWVPIIGPPVAPFDLINNAGWLAVWTAADLSQGNGTPVTTWPSSAPASGYNLPATGGSPTYVSSWAALNNQPAIALDGVDDVFRLNFVGQGGSLPNISVPYSVIVVATIEAGAGNDARYVLTNPQTNPTIPLKLTSGNNLYTGTYQGTTGLAIYDVDHRNASVMTTVVSDTEALFQINSSTNGPAPAPDSATVATCFQLGNSNAIPQDAGPWHVAFVGLATGDITKNPVLWDVIKSSLADIYGVTL